MPRPSDLLPLPEEIAPHKHPATSDCQHPDETAHASAAVPGSPEWGPGSPAPAVRRGGQGFADVAGQRGDQVGGGEDGRQAQEAGKAQRQAALDAQAADGGVEQLGPRAVDDAGVRLAAVVVQAEERAGADAGVVGMRQADPVLVIQSPCW